MRETFDFPPMYQKECDKLDCKIERFEKTMAFLVCTHMIMLRTMRYLAIHKFGLQILKEVASTR